ncbi:MAG: hypothetical protein KGJ11_09420, partial [Candidatus Omnitrophica bacterium]|nr:hypothetical protein [Candidatus Omnitrophota bacterium]
QYAKYKILNELILKTIEGVSETNTVSITSKDVLQLVKDANANEVYAFLKAILKSDDQDLRLLVSKPLVFPWKAWDIHIGLFREEIRTTPAVDIKPLFVDMIDAENEVVLDQSVPALRSYLNKLILYFNAFQDRRGMEYQGYMLNSLRRVLVIDHNRANLMQLMKGSGSPLDKINGSELYWNLVGILNEFDTYPEVREFLKAQDLGRYKQYFSSRNPFFERLSTPDADEDLQKATGEDQGILPKTRFLAPGSTMTFEAGWRGKALVRVSGSELALGFTNGELFMADWEGTVRRVVDANKSARFEGGLKFTNNGTSVSIENNTAITLEIDYSVSQDPAMRSSPSEIKAVKDGFSYADAKRWYMAKRRDHVTFPRGFWDNEITAKNYILAVLDSIGDESVEDKGKFEAARKAGDIKRMAELYRKYVIAYKASDSKRFTDGQIGFFRERGGLSGLMASVVKKPYLDKESSPAALLRFALPRLVDQTNPEALRTLEIEDNYWTQPENAKKAVLAALDPLDDGQFKSARLAHDVKSMADIYRRDVIGYVAQDQARWTNGQYTFFIEVGHLGGLIMQKQAFLEKQGSPAALLKFALPELVDQNNPDALRLSEIANSANSAMVSVLPPVSGARKQALNLLNKIPEFDGLVSESAPDFARMEVLGEGGAASVYQDPDDTSIFYKVAHRGPSNKTTKDSARLIYHMNESGIQGVPQLLEVGVDENNAFWMKLKGIEGGVSLNKSPEFWFAMPMAAKIGIVQGLVQTLQAVHQLGWAHNDIKPANIVVNARGEFML